MSPFSNDPFDDIMREFFGSSQVRRQRRNQFINGEEEDRVIDYVEDEDYIYMVFELPGYEEDDVSVTVNGSGLEITAQKSNEKNMQTYLNEKLKQGLRIKKQLPKNLNPKNFKKTLRNGILELSFLKSNNGGKK